MIKAVMFDVGGVLLRTEEPYHRRELEARLGLSPGESEDIVFNSEVGTRAQLGHIGVNDLWMWVGRRLNLDGMKLDEFRRDFWAGDRLDEELISFIRGLRPKYQTAVISNATNALRKTLDDFGIADAFDLVVCSAEENVMKPDPEIFRRTLERLKYRPDETVFVDDSPVNVTSARQMGIKAIRFTPKLDWKKALKGVEVEPD